MSDAVKILNEIIVGHDKYIASLDSITPTVDCNLTPEEKVDRVAFHVVEEIIETRRTYHHKFWKQTIQETNKEALMEEMADVFLMARSMWLEVCKCCNITEEQFFKIVLNKVMVNQQRRQNGY